MAIRASTANNSPCMYVYSYLQTGLFSRGQSSILLMARYVTGSCGQAGENCTLVETTLVNGESTADINLIPPLASHLHSLLQLKDVIALHTQAQVFCSEWFLFL